MPNPLVSIGVPVFNAERFLARALDSMLSQTLTDFELIISDNSSTDRTPEICEEYLRRDPRVRYIRQPVNIGAARNWNLLVHEARGVFFKWASANDYCAPEMLEKCVSAMKADPGVVLCYGKTQFVDLDERPIRIDEHESSFNEAQPSERYRRVTATKAWNSKQSGVFRLDVLRRTRLNGLYPTSDLALMSELALYGRFQLIDQVLLFRCESDETSTVMLNPLERQRVYDPQAKAPMRFVVTRRRLQDLVSIWRAPIPLSEKLRAYRFALRFIRWSRVAFWREFRRIVPGLRRIE